MIRNYLDFLRPITSTQHMAGKTLSQAAIAAMARATKPAPSINTPEPAPSNNTPEPALKSISYNCIVCLEEYPHEWDVSNTYRCCSAKWCASCDSQLTQCPQCRHSPPPRAPPRAPTPPLRGPFPPPRASNFRDYTSMPPTVRHRTIRPPGARAPIPPVTPTLPPQRAGRLPPTDPWISPRVKDKLAQYNMTLATICQMYRTLAYDSTQIADYQLSTGARPAFKVQDSWYYIPAYSSSNNWTRCGKKSLLQNIQVL